MSALFWLCVTLLVLRLLLGGWPDFTRTDKHTYRDWKDRQR